MVMVFFRQCLGAISGFFSNRNKTENYVLLPDQKPKAYVFCKQSHWQGKKTLLALYFVCIITIIYILYTGGMLLIPLGTTYTTISHKVTLVETQVTFSMDHEVSDHSQSSEKADDELTLTTEVFVELNSTEIPHTAKNQDLVAVEQTCKIPQLAPFDDSIKQYFHKPKDIDCTKKYNRPIIFSTDLNSKLITLVDPANYNLFHCCYKQLIRLNENKSRFLSKCYPITKKVMSIPPTHEFIAIYCNKKKLNGTQKLIDMFHFVPNKNRTDPFSLPSSGPVKKESLNIVLLGIDAVSHMNFIRTMPKSYRYLKVILSAINMNGYTKVGDNTFPNIVPIVMGASVSELKNLCHNKSQYFDSCPFIWKKFSQTGHYYTSYIEDESWMSAFNYGSQGGFKNPPTDFYLRPFTYTFQKKLGHKSGANTQMCYGPRFAFTLGLDHIQKMAIRAATNEDNNTNTDYPTRYFTFSWSNSLTHDTLNLPRLGDNYLLSFLKWFNEGKRKQLDKNALLVLLSDHGIRWGKIRTTVQGRIEERMPFLYFVFPQWFKEKYNQAIENLESNGNRLTTPFDLHETLADLVNPEISISKYELLRRGSKLKRDKNGHYPRGISLFLPIPLDRACLDAGIDSHWCVCHSMEPISDLDDQFVVGSVNFLLNHINKVLEKFPQCSQLELEKIINAQQQTSALMSTTTTTSTPKYSTLAGTESENVDEDEDEIEDIIEVTNTTTKRPEFIPKQITITFQTIPGQAIFEASVVEEGKRESWKLAGDISRLNLYRNQSACLKHATIQKFCYCLNNPQRNE